jgi:hypothetical protein
MSVHDGPEGRAIQHQGADRLDVSTLNEEQLEALEMALLATMGPVGSVGPI